MWAVVVLPLPCYLSSLCFITCHGQQITPEGPLHMSESFISSLSGSGIRGLRSLCLAPATARRKPLFLKKDRGFDPEAAITLPGPLI